jgi:hypothetical protein
MRIRPFAIALTCCLLATALYGQARRPGLYEVTTTMTWIKSPLPPGMSMPANSPFSGAARTTQVCLTQAQIDKYGAPVWQSKDCQIVNVALSSNGMKAEMVCTGQMNGRGTLESHWDTGNAARSKVHFTGTMQAGQQGSMAVEWISESSSVYRGAECGSVKPVPMAK